MKFLKWFFPKDLFKSIVTTFSNRVIIIILGLFLSIFVTRSLGPEGRGLYALIIFLISLGLQIGNLGIQSTNTYLLSRDKSLKENLVINSFFASASLGSMVIIFLYLIQSLQIYSFGLEGLVFLITLLSIPFALGYQFFLNILLGEKRIKEFNFFELGNKIFSAIVIVIFFIFISKEPIPISSAIFISYFVPSIVIFLFLKQFNFKKSNLKLLLDNLNYGLKGYGSAFLNFFQQRISILLMQSKFGLESLGYYSVALILFDFAYLFPSVIGNIAFPYLSEKENEKSRKIMFLRLLLFTGLISFLSVMILYVFGDDLLKLLFGQDFIKSFQYLKVLLPGLFFASLISINMNYLASCGMPKIVVISPIAGLASLLIFYFALIDHLGPLTPGAATSFSLGVIFIISICYIISQDIK